MGMCVTPAWWELRAWRASWDCFVYFPALEQDQSSLHQPWQVSATRIFSQSAGNHMEIQWSTPGSNNKQLSIWKCGYCWAGLLLRKQSFLKVMLRAGDQTVHSLTRMSNREKALENHCILVGMGKKLGTEVVSCCFCLNFFFFSTPPVSCRASPPLCLDKELWHWRLTKVDKHIHHHGQKDKGSTHSLKFIFLCWTCFSIILDHLRFTLAASLGGFPLCHGQPKSPSAAPMASLEGTFELLTSAFA